MKRLFDKMKFEITDCRLSRYYENACKRFSLCGNEIFYFEKYDIIDDLYDEIRQLRDQAMVDPDNARYCYLLSEVLKHEDLSVLGKICSPRKTDKSPLYDTLPLFSLLDLVPDMITNLQQRGVPSNIISDTCKMFELQVKDYIALYHRCGVSIYVEWLLRFLKCKVIRVGRFNLEMTTYNAPYDAFSDGVNFCVIPNDVIFHKSGQVLGSVGCEAEEEAFEGKIVESEDCYKGILIERGICRNQPLYLPKKQWHRVVCPGTPVISVHIPLGGPLEFPACCRDLKYGKAVINQCFGQYNYFYCKSWLLDPQLKHILGRESNLTRFAGLFHCFPAKSSARGIYEHIYGVPVGTPVEELSERTSLSRAVKTHLLTGGYVWGAYGLIDKIPEMNGEE